MKEFDLAISQLSLAHLKRIAVEYQKNTEACEDKQDYVGLLTATMSRAQKTKLLQTILLAGRTSMSLFHISGNGFDVNLRATFQEATEVPQIVHVGKVNEIAAGQKHIMWAMLDGTATFIDTELELQVEPRAVIIDTFWDAKSQVLQVRANSTGSKKISRQFAKLLEIDGAARMSGLGLATREQMNEFADLLGATVVQCKGEKKTPKGFIYVSGEADAADDENMGDSEDYKEFAANTEPISETLKFRFNERDVKLGIAFITESVVFKTAVDEETIQFVYGTLKEYLGH